MFQRMFRDTAGRAFDHTRQCIRQRHIFPCGNIPAVKNGCRQIFGNQAYGLESKNVAYGRGYIGKIAFKTVKQRVKPLKTV